ncbi:MAG: VapC toxin family PIN domain ribonuclease [Actinobacteria bacterium]|nr:MAG: VapC toxin family PIN domain ribonuclease [Actinomycetota bacterium]
MSVEGSTTILNIEWAASVPASRFYLSVISILEIEHGVLLEIRKDKKQGALLRAWVDDEVLPRFEGRILPIDVDVTLQCAKLHVPDPQPERDALIAATALVHKLTVVTRNVNDFLSTGVQVLNPWEETRDNER